MSLQRRLDVLEEWAEGFEAEDLEVSRVDERIRCVAREYDVSFKQLRKNYLRVVPCGVLTANNMWAVCELERQAEMIANEVGRQGIADQG